MTEIVLASRNAHKLQELSQILRTQLPDVTLSGDDGPEPRETGTTFAENALLKARAAAARTGKIAIADDSGIAVDILGGSPGIFSARWAGARGSDTDNLQLLLAQLADIAQPHRQAAFVCAAAAVVPFSGESAREIVVVANWHGQLLTAPQGAGGFGYDPIFQPDGFDCSAAELAPEIKNQISHRFLAFSELAPKLRTVLASPQQKQLS